MQSDNFIVPCVIPACTHYDMRENAVKVSLTSLQRKLFKRLTSIDVPSENVDEGKMFLIKHVDEGKMLLIKYVDED